MLKDRVKVSLGQCFEQEFERDVVIRVFYSGWAASLCIAAVAVS